MSKTYLGESTGVAREVSSIYELQTSDEKGILNPRADDYAEFDEKFEQNRIKKID